MTRKTLSIATIATVLFFAAALGFSADTASITLTGIVSQILEITVTGESSYDNLDLTTTQNDLLVATVNEKSNNQAGYTVAVESQNAAAAGVSTAFFKGADVGNTDTLDYSMTYDGVAVVLDGAGTAIVSDVSGTTGTSGVDKQLAISYTGAFLNADTYSDTLTFTIAAK